VTVRAKTAQGLSKGKHGRAATKAAKASRPAAVPPKRTQPAPRNAAPAKTSPPSAGMALHTKDGARKYLTAGERDAFLHAAEQEDRQVRTLCMTIAYAGCRLSEALALTVDRVDLAAGVLVIKTLKRRRTIHRAVPVPPALLDALDMVHGVRELQARRDKGREIRLWPWCRMTGWRAVHAVMTTAGITGPHACSKGLRHGFGVRAISEGISLNMVQKWLGHAHITTTVVYTDAVGEEEQSIAAKMW
jgi:integrase/recombinase XerD